MQHKDSHIFIGMQQDLSPTKHKPEFMCDAHNVRITSSDKEDTYLSLTNEKGTLKVNLSQNIEGHYLGHCVASIYNENLKEDEDVIILFCTKLNSQNPDYIYKITLNDDIQKPVQLLYNGNLNFNIEHPIETFFISEAIDINKVYWNDGYNQPRVINLNNIKASSNFDTQFDFIPTLNLEESITVERQLLGGLFLPGVIQYAFSYYNKFGQESNIFYTSQLNYIMFEDRGGSPEEFVPNSFKITISSWQEGFDYLRIYSIHRTTLDAVPQCKIVQDIDLRDITDQEIVFIDNGQIGEFTDPAQFPYIGGQDIIAQTWDQKDNTLFLGNITINKPSIANIKILDGNESIDINTYIQNNADDILFSFGSISKDGINPGFKCGEEYRIGFQAQYKDGSWSEPIWIKDFTSPLNNKPHMIVDSTDIYSPAIKCVLPQEVLNTIKDKGYKNVRGLCVFPKISERNIVAQGIVTPTILTNIEDINTQKNLSSWFFRPQLVDTNKELYPEFRHGFPIKNEFSLPEVNNNFYVDYSILSLYSPDIEFNQDLEYLNKEDLSLNLLGYIDFDSIQTNKQLKVSSPAKLPNGGEIQNVNSNVLLGIPWWKDGVIKYTPATSEDPEEKELIETISGDKYFEVDYIVYPWQASGPLNNDIESNIAPTSMLKQKVLSLMMDSTRGMHSIEGLQTSTFDISGQKVIDNTEEILNIINNSDGTTFKYQENVDTTLMGTPYKGFAYSHRDYTNPESPAYLTITSVSEDTTVIASNPNTDYIAGRNSFIPIKYKSSRHLVINNNNNILPLLSSSVESRDIPFIFNDQILSSVFYYKVPPRSEVEMQGVVFSTVNDVHLSDFDILYLKEVSYSSNSATYFPEIYNYSKQFNGDPFLILLDLSNYPTILDTGGQSILGDKFLAIARGFQAYDSNRTLNCIQVDFSLCNLAKFYNPTTQSLDPLQGNPIYIKVPYEYEYNSQIQHSEVLVKQDSEFNVGFIRRWSNGYSQPEAQRATVIGFKIKYDSKLPSQDVSTTGYAHYVNDYDADFLIGRGQKYELYYTILEDGTAIGKDTEAINKIINGILNQPIVLISDNGNPKLFLCEIFRDSSNINNKFGGSTQEALKSNLWIPVSNTYSIDYLLEQNNYILIDRGDTWFQKYYCLKTYPYATTDENQMINKAGFYCETRYNLYGVYDKDKPSTQLFINKDSFNKFNYVYNQSDNFFNYRILDKEFYTRDNFPYSFFWTKEKVNTAEIDNYTNLNLVTSLDVNSVGGEISKIIVHNGQIYCFQPDGINRILFNSRVQIPVSDGVPIEIANSAKLEGVSTITNTIGCDNKWAAISTNSGLFFLDNRRKGLFLIGDEGFPQNLTAQFNMNNWFSKHNLDKWGKDSSGNWIGTKLCDDYNGNDIYLIKENDNNNEGALVYSKRIGQFTSFMSYGETDSIFNAGEYLYAFKNIDGELDLYRMNSGDYNYFFNQYEPFDFTFISTGDTESGGPATDKIFTNVELRATFSEDKYFNYIQSKNDYQDTGICTINKNILAVNRHFSRGDTARKFRIWRTDIPRVLEGNKRTLNRIRNIWTKIKLGITKESSSNFKMELHDINVLYHI